MKRTPHLHFAGRILSGLRLVLGVFAAWTALHAEKLVVVRSTADTTYFTRRTADGNLRPETYVFMPGNYFAGFTHDTMLDRMKFTDIAQVLAQDLQTRKYLPAAEPGRADLLLVVHWGVTTKIENSYDLHLDDIDAARQQLADYQAQEAFETEQAAAGNFMPLASSPLGGIEQVYDNELRAVFSRQQDGLGSAASNGELLGLTGALRKEEGSIMFSEKYRTLHGMTQEERYFIIVMAYDMPALLQAGKTRRLWTCRLSIRAAGVNFVQAVNRMSTAGATLFGTKQDDVVFKRPGERTATVEIGEIKVVGSTGPETDSGRRK